LRCIVVNANADAAGVRRDIVNAIRDGFTKLFVNEIMYVDLIWAALRAIVAAAIFIRTDQLLFLCID
jgi:hypothetical protein